MKTLFLTAPEPEVEPRELRALVPGDLPGWHLKIIPARSLGQSGAVPDVTLVRIDSATAAAEVKRVIPRLARMHEKAKKGSYVLFSFRIGAKARPRRTKAQQKHFHDVAAQIRKELRGFPCLQRVDVTFAPTPSAMATVLDDVRAKLDLGINIMDAQVPGRAPRTSPLDEVKQVVKATEDMRVAGGNISAERVANLYGVSVNQLAKWLGRSRQAVSKTPDADSLQPALSFFERVARLRLAVKSDSDFRKWLRTPQPLLENASPLQLMAKGEWQVTADFVDDALTGAPT